jgi:hypothetical protein
VTMDAERERLVELLASELDRAPVEALEAEGRADWRWLAGEMTTTKDAAKAELETAEPESEREAALRAALGMKPRAVGPGEELKKRTDALGLKEWEGCSCEAIRQAMNAAGVAGCREKRDDFVRRLKENIEQGIKRGKIPPDYGSGAKWKAVTTGIAFHLSSWADPIAGLFDLAVNDAEKAEAKKGTIEP